MPKQSPSQTVGPYFNYGLFRRGNENTLVNAQSKGQCILIEGQVFDGDDSPVTDAMVEIWQADAQGHFNHPNDPKQSEADPNFRGFGRSETRGTGRYQFKTVKPGLVATADGQLQAPHVFVYVFARGMLIQAATRLYFSDEAAANAADPVLSAVAPERQQTLIATLSEENDLPTYHLDIHLQGDNETVFFDY